MKKKYRYFNGKNVVWDNIVVPVNDSNGDSLERSKQKYGLGRFLRKVKECLPNI